MPKKLIQLQSLNISIKDLIILKVEYNNLTDHSVYIKWELNHNATGQVEYGKSTAYGKHSTKEKSFNYKNHIIYITNLQANTTYHYRVISQDAKGKKVISGDYTFKTKGKPNIDTTPPVITLNGKNPITIYVGSSYKS